MLRLSGSTRVWILNILLAGGAVASFVAVAGLQPVSGRPVMAWPLLALAFYFADVLVVHFHFRRDAHSFSLSEVPLVIGLYFTSAPGLIVAQAVGAAVALAIHRRQSPLKLAFNVGLLSLEAGMATAIFHALEMRTPQIPGAWLAAMIATTLPAVFGATMIQTVISLAEGAPQFQKFGTVLSLHLAGTVTNTALGLVAVSTLSHDPAAGWLLLVPAATLYLAYKAYMSERQKHDSIEFLFESSRMLQRSTEVEPAMIALLAHVRKMFRAELAEIVLLHADGQGGLRTRVGPGSLTEVMQQVRLTTEEMEVAMQAEAGPGVLLMAGPEKSRDSGFLASRGLKDAMVACLRGESRTIGFIAACNRLGEVTSFDSEDLRLFETLAGQASISLENGRLEQSLAQLRKLEEELKHQAFHDSLTRLANRVLFANRVEHAMLRRVDDGTQVAVLFLDLDDFKTVNDTLGHAAGDQLLVGVARRLEHCLRPQDTAARLGGDEFAILLDEVADVEEAVEVAGRVLTALQPPILLGGHEVSVHASIGIVVTPSGGDADEALRNADVAMYTAKRGGKGRYEIFHPRMQALVVGRHELKVDLQRALERDEFVVHYQPMVDLRSGGIVALEALVRWRKPRRGIIGPDQFIPLAEETGLILPLGAYVLEEACRRAREWQLAYPDHSALSMSVNISVKQLQSPGLVDDVVGALRRSGLDPSSLILEITESAMMEDPEQMVGRLRQLKELGVRLAIDDFGTGYSSLSWLRHFPIDILKIAKPFIEGLGEEPGQRAFADAIAKLGNSLSMVVVAEGVEHLRQVQHLAELHLTLVQGFYFKRPVTAEEINDMLRTPASRTDWAVSLTA